ncbi:FUSC family protein [Cupriavidus sp. CV2]|uniref:FUSC family protein n=1 Tax=Cupriavidus ulmosensis TaxID=3065913 RepID=UPI00296B5859|nr:FUSC family protein [Cupriavidus sp. CV2]MDW3686461.1 FUSC family protein [Cupriavidus sp. CV2]
MISALRLPRPDASMLQRGLVYAFSFLVLAGTGWLTGEAGYLWAATASIWTCLADRRGTAAERLAALGSVGIGGAAACALGTAAAVTPWTAVAVVLVAGLAAGLAETRGPVPALSAKLLYVVLIASCLQPAGDGELAVRVLARSQEFLLGGLFACVVSVALIRSARDTRPRAEILAVFDALLRFASDLAADAPVGDATVIKRDIRERIEAAHLAINMRRSLRDPLGLMHYAYVVSLADAMFALLIVAAELRSRADDAGSKASDACSVEHLPLRHLLRCVTDVREQVCEGLAHHAPDLPSLCAALAGELRRLHAPLANAGAPPLYQAALSALARYPAFGDWRREYRWPRRALRRTWQRWRAVVAEHTARDARVARHAVRLALAGSLSLMPAQFWKVDHGYWVAVTVIMVLSPQLQTTRRISFLRFAGSLAGALLACAIGLAHPPAPLALAISAACLAAAYTCRLAGSPGAFAMCLTPAVILFSWVGAPAADSSHFAALRGIDTALGCLIALASYYVLAPRAELSRVYRHSLDALASNTAYLRAAFAGASAFTTSPTRSPAPTQTRLEALRMAAGRTSSRADQTLQQGVAELAPELAREYAQLHLALRRMAALAGLVRAGLEAEAGKNRAEPATQAVLQGLAAQLSELAANPGASVTSLASAFLPDSAAPLDRFLVEQAGFASAQINAAHAAVAAVHRLAGGQPKPNRPHLPYPG